MIDETFYKVVDKKVVEQLHHSYDVEFNVEHVIFQAHFPDNPIVPGVCSLEIMRQFAQTMLGGEIRIPAVKNIKFVSLMTPAKGKIFTFDMQLLQKAENQYGAKVSISEGETMLVKASVVFDKV